MTGSDGKASAYWPEVHWTMDDQDSITPASMEKMKEKIQTIIEAELSEVRKAQ